MKKFYKIIIAFLIIFLAGLCITYLVINSKLNNDTQEVSCNNIPIALLKKTTKVITVSF